MACVRRPFSVFAVGVLLAAAAAGCHKRVPPQTAAVPGASGQAAIPAPLAVPPPPPAPAPSPAPVAPAPARLTDEDLFARKALDELNAEHQLADVFFDLDKSEIREDAKAPLSKDADWMKKWAGTSVMVEGHCDARGSSEYNLALGSRRAEAVKSYLVSLGVPAERLVVVSKGKEQPVCQDENDACWQQNRRGHFIVTSK
jgi:peptidoglycan-associated lipoprotein